ncbi:MAG: 50S ribosomal protein L11 methyltransferase [Bacillota bacterium]|nr:MAG: 50S ribosomal protein L11 methyltransferase [Bacillota bacterium]
MRYLEVCVRARREAVEAVEALLGELAGGGVVVEDPLDVHQAIASGRWDATDLVPGDPAWVTLKVYFPDLPGLEESRQRLEEGLSRIRALGLGEVAAPAFAWVDEADWAENWKRYFKLLRVGQRLVVVPTWEAYQPAPGEVPIYLDPGMAFGTGQHATTALCLEGLEACLRPGEAVLDVGTGSGILAIAAARLGAAAVLGLEVDPVAVGVARENVRVNQVADRVTVCHATLAVPAAGGGGGAPGGAGPADRPLPGFAGPDAAEAEAWLRAHRPNLALANLTAAILVDLRHGLAAALPPGGRLLASGVIAERRDEVAAALEAVGFHLEEVREREGWVALSLRRR